ncbi:cation:proton antiporter [Rhodohalobacter mucosus]|uniref:cation:proton antiporter n=1 Tax=Rhodohalobacter mucosus TaxID=2079485 RepID=UPI001304A80A|nr:cation:proton antiporter [Rhodohalobacter mucosus]
MNILLTIGLILIIGYTAGWAFDKMGLPRIIGYIATGILFSPNTFDFVPADIMERTFPLMEVCLAFITFEVGGALRWSKVKKHEKEIISITMMASMVPLFLVAGGVLGIGLVFPSSLPFDTTALLMLALLLGAVAIPTEPAATFAVMHQYKAKGKVSDTILGVAALDDVLGVLMFSLTITVIFFFAGGEAGLFGNPALNGLYEIVIAILIGIVVALFIDPIAKFFKVEGEGQWVVIIFSLIIFCVGLAKAIHADLLLATMTMGIVVVNKSGNQKVIFEIIERYTEDLIFLFFFLLSGMQLNISTIPQATLLIVLFVILRTVAKFLGAGLGAKIVSAKPAIQKYTAGGLLPQGGIVIGLVLSIYQQDTFTAISDLLLAVIMGAVVIHELLGPVAAKYSLIKAGEIDPEKTEIS